MPRGGYRPCAGRPKGSKSRTRFQAILDAPLPPLVKRRVRRRQRLVKPKLMPLPDALKYMAAVETIIQHRMAYCHSELLELSEVDMDAISRDCGPFRSSYYVYGLVDPRNEHIFYIGKGRGDRAWQHRCDDDADTNERKKRRISDIVQAGYEPEVRLLLRVPSEHVAYLIESALIAFLPGLMNIVGQRRNASTQECQARGVC